MGPDPFNMPGFGSLSAAANSQALGETINQFAPLAPEWHGVMQGPAPQQVFTQINPPQASGGFLSNITHFIGGVGNEIGHIAGGAAKWLGSQISTGVQAPGKFVSGISHGIQDRSEINQVQAESKQATDRLDTLASQYKAGRISKNTYQSGLKDLTQFEKSTSDKATAVQNRIKGDQNMAVQGAIGVASDVVTIMTAGLGRVAAVGAEELLAGERAAAGFLASHAPSEFLSAAEQGINKLATNPELFSQMAPAAQRAIQMATAEVVSTSASMTAKQIARTAAVNLALKYPIYFNMLSTQSQQIYAKLDNRKYGSAVQQVAINAALLLSGGPIGWALKQGGKAFGAVGAAVFGRTAFIDELSKGIGDGSLSGLYRAINAIKDPAVKQEVVNNLSAVEATNLGAVAGRDPVAAAWRVLNGMSNYEGMSMSNFTHEEALNNMVNFAKAQRTVDEIGQAQGLGLITVGRVDARALDTISAGLTKSDLLANVGTVTTTGDRLKVWEQLKADNPTQAWANNENFDRQVKSLINKYGTDSSSLDTAIKNIRASFNVEGFPKAAAERLAKAGYIPIKPVNLEAPFREGEGKLATSQVTHNDEFFVKAVKPLPVLSSVGALLTGMGLSPTGATGRVYQLFNQGLAENLIKSDAISRFADKAGTDAETADILIKRLSSYAHDPQTFAQKAFPITDLRQMTTGDIMKAIPEFSRANAREVKGAIMDAMLQVPLKVRGLGDKLVDVSYKINPVQKAFLRVQGGARFAWNPFFQAKLAYKTELLTQAEAGGHFPTLLGTNKVLSVVFPGKYNQLDDVRDLLRNNGIFDSKAGIGESLTGEAVNDTVTGSNLTHKLLPSQERSIAALVSVQADRLNMSVQDFVRYNTQDVRDTVQTIAQYDRRSQFLNSAMARTLNLAFFPFRFEFKVGTIMAKSLAQRSAMTQLAVINGLYQGHNWLNSPEGQAWYSQNSKVIGLMKYFTPLQTLGEVSTALGMHPDAIGQFGELGGLPFGWIPQLLDAEGLTHFSAPYVSPTTGQVVPNYIPATDKGALALAIQDLIGALYTYPGIEAGLPSKAKLDRNIALAVTGADKKTDLSQVAPPTPSDQVNFSQAVQAAAAQRAQQQGQIVVPKNQTNIPQAPTQFRPLTQVPTQANFAPGKQPKARAGRTPRLKKSQFKPALLPGQTSIGQL